MTPQIRMRDPGGRHEYPWNLPFRRAVHHLRPGRFDARVLDQRNVWVDSAGHVRRIRDLSDEHLANVIAMLRRSALSVFLDYSMAAGLGRFTPRTTPPPVVGDPRGVALGWLTSTRLWLALHVETAARTNRDPEEVRRLNATSGRWVVRTEDATYVADLDVARMLTVLAPEDTRRVPARWEPLSLEMPTRVSRPLRRATGPGSVRRRDERQLARLVVSIRPLPAGVGVDADSVARAARLATRLYSRLRIETDLTEMRTPVFLEAVSDVRAVWAALDALLKRHHATGALLVPARLRDSGAAEASVDLCVAGLASPEYIAALQRDVDDAVGYHLPVTTADDYTTDITLHAARLEPGL
jgi:hypothetical protein